MSENKQALQVAALKNGELDSVFGRFFPERLCDEQNENRLQRKEFLVTSDRIYPYR